MTADQHEGPTGPDLKQGIPAGDVPDFADAYLQLARGLAGRKATVAVATHDPALAEAALRILLDAGTPC